MEHNVSDIQTKGNSLDDIYYKDIPQVVEPKGSEKSSVDKSLLQFFLVTYSESQFSDTCSSFSTTHHGLRVKSFCTVAHQGHMLTDGRGRTTRDLSEAHLGRHAADHDQFRQSYNAADAGSEIISRAAFQRALPP